MSLLLDTQILLWWMLEPEKLSVPIQRLITRNSCVVSVASIWEIGIKRSIGKLNVPPRLLEILKSYKFEILRIEAEHALAAGALPMIHKDPFDRMLVAQALAEDLTLVSADGRMPLYVHAVGLKLLAV